MRQVADCIIYLQLDEVNRESASELREQLKIQKEVQTVHLAESMEMQVRGRDGWQIEVKGAIV